MQIGSSLAWTLFSGTSSSATTSSSKSSPHLAILETHTKALETLRQTMTTSADAAKARAARKLEEAKQQLQMLQSGGLPPEVVARLAAELAHKVSAAASELAAAVASGAASAGASASLAAAAGAGTTGGNAGEGAGVEAGADTAEAAAATGDTTEDTGVGEAAQAYDTDEEADGATQARNAYRSVVEDGEQATSGISAEDRQMMEEFKALLRDIKQVLDKAMRDLRAKGSDTTGGMAVAAQAAGVQMPTSITV